MSYEDNLAKFRKLLDVLRGKVDIRERFGFLFDPSNIKTASRLSASQVEFVADAHFLANRFPEFEPLKELAIEVAESCVSHKGQRVGEAIAFERASAGQKDATQIGIFQQLKDKVKKPKEEKDIEQ